MTQQLPQGLTHTEVAKRKSLGLSNKRIDSYTPSYFRIFRRNFFNLMNIVLLPLVVLLFIFDVEREVIVFSIFMVANSIINTFDEVRVKRRLEALKNEFERTASVIREGKEDQISADEVVKDDLIVVREGESIIADGEIIRSEYLKIDESALTGESDYIEKQEKDLLLSGSFVVTGTCIYKVQKVGSENYLNKLGAEATKFVDTKSKLEKNGERFIYSFVAIALSMVAIHFLAVEGQVSSQDLLLSMTTIAAMAIPQTLLFLFVLSFIISITKLARKGILIQKKGAIDELAAIDIVCLDKTGTITTNEMEVVDMNLGDQEKLIISAYLQNESEIYGRNKTFNAILNHLREKAQSEQTKEVRLINQIPFTSRDKFSTVTVQAENEVRTVVLGAPGVVNRFSPENIDTYVSEQEQKGYRVVAGVVFEGDITEKVKAYFQDNSETEKSLNLEDASKKFLFTLEETLNPGVEEVIEDLAKQDIKLFFISGDSPTSVKRILDKVNIDTSSSIDLSTQENINLEQEVKNGINIFTRAKPEQKTEIIGILQKQGHKVAMVGDGINDVVSLKQANVGIAMENGTSVARDVADIVLLENDYRKIPNIFFEGNNLMFNLKMTTKIYFARLILAIGLTFFFSANRSILPILPTSTLIFSFIGNSLPSYILAFSRQNIKKQLGFSKDVLRSSIPTGLIFAIATLAMYRIGVEDLPFVQLGTLLVIFILATALAYSLYLFWESGKLGNNWHLMLLFFVYAVVFGTIQAIAPIRAFESTELQLQLMAIAFVLGVIAVGFFWIMYKKLKTKILKLASILVLPIMLLLAYFAPATSYYATEAFPARYFIPLTALTIATIFAFVGVLKFVPKEGEK